VLRAFTLVELLGVIGIIALLISILLPALAAVRRHANSLKCMSNLRTLGQAMSLYTQQTGVYPPGFAFGGFHGHGVAAWPTELRMYMNGQRQPFRCPERDERFEWSANPINAVGPAPAEFGVYGYALGEPLLDSEFTPFSYGYNQFGGDGPNGLSFDFGPVPNPMTLHWLLVKTSQVRAPEDMIAFTDSSGLDFATGTNDFYLYPFQDGAYSLPGAVHFGGPNVLFCDGHVEWYSLNDITIPPHADWSSTRIQNIAKKWSRFHTVFGR
jgi:prepilin-type processing-associated H-X9-DG protein